jgi:CspA family cold shock protein
MNLANHRSEPESDKRYRGKVVWFNANLGYGFVKADDTELNNGKDIFCHYHSIVQAGFKTLQINDIVEFAFSTNRNGICAVDIKLIQRFTP